MKDEEIFHQVLQQKVENRPAFLEAACGADSDLRQRLAVLLNAQENPGSFLEQPVFGAADLPTLDQPTVDRIGSQIGPYKLLEEIGEGGMGTVYMAEQKKPVRRCVALKIVKAGMDSRQVLARFDAERQALAMMDHPSIAKIFDAGTTELGRPYFVMELVRGIPINEFCDQNRLTVRERLELFLKVCQAVQHAHQKGIIHRDLKPTNVLVTKLDVVAVPKVIDFGIAKAFGSQLTDHTQVTGFAQFLGTPQYMSPEQAEMNQLGVDTRSDVYSLGVMLYELLTGDTPFDKDTVKTSNFNELRRMLREVEPPNPSSRISTLNAQALSTVSERRGSDPHRMVNILRGELDWIVMRALEKDRERRYESASSLAADVERYLHDEPVLACPPSTTYRLQKLARRHQGALATTAIVFAALLIGTTVATWQAVRAMQAQSLSKANEVRAQGEELKARENLKQARQAVNEMYSDVAVKWLENEPELEELQKQFLFKALAFYEQFAEKKETDPAMRFHLGIANFRAGNIQCKLLATQKAEEAFGEAISVFEQLANEFPTEQAYRLNLAEVHCATGQMLDGARRYSEAESHVRKALVLYEGLVIEFPKVDVIRNGHVVAMWLLALTLTNTGRHSEADQVYAQALPLQEQLLAETPNNDKYQSELASGLHNLAILRSAQNRWTEARQLVERAIQHQQSAVQARPREHQYRVCFANHHWLLAMVLKSLQQPEEAERALQQEFVHRERLVSDFPSIGQYRWLLANNRSSLGLLLADARRDQEAEACYRQAQQLFDELTLKFPDVFNYQHKMGGTLHNLGIILKRRGEWAEAIRLTELAIEHQQAARKLDARDPFCRRFLRNHYSGLAEYLATCPDPQLNHPVRALELANKAIELDPQQGESYANLGRAQYRLGDWQAALVSLKKGLELSGMDGIEPLPGTVRLGEVHNQFRGEDRFFLAMAYWQLQQKDEAKRSFDQAVEWMESNEPENEELIRFRAEAAELLGIQRTSESVDAKQPEE